MQLRGKIRVMEVKELFNKKESRKKSKYFVFSTFGELLDLAIALQDEGHEVLFYVPDSEYKKIGDGIVPKAHNWHECFGKGYVWIVDGCENASLQDWLRANGESVVGTTEGASEYENDRQKGQQLFKEIGFAQPDSENFTDFESAKEYVENYDGRLIMKQNGDLPKSLNHAGKFETGEDMMFHLEETEKGWDPKWGAIDFDLMGVVEGMEVAASAFFNGHDWLRNDKGKVVGFLNWEHKKQLNGDLGPSTGETGTLFQGVDEDNDLFSDILMSPKIKDFLKKHDYRGVFDINGCLTEDGFVGFEPTCRFGVPATSYEFIAGLESPIGELIDAMAQGKDTAIQLKDGYGMVIVLYAPPFPVEADLEDRATSLGEKLWIIKDGAPQEDFDKKQKRRVHLENFYKDEEGNYRIATKNGYLLTVSGTGESIEEVRADIIDFVKENIFITDMGYRTDIGQKIEEYL